MCAPGYLQDYGAVGGKWERVDPSQGRVGSVFSDPNAGLLMSAETDQGWSDGDSMPSSSEEGTYDSEFEDYDESADGFDELESGFYETEDVQQSGADYYDQRGFGMLPPGASRYVEPESTGSGEEQLQHWQYRRSVADHAGNSDGGIMLQSCRSLGSVAASGYKLWDFHVV